MSTHPDPHRPRSTRHHPHPTGGLRTIWLIAQREITTRLRSKAFLVSTGILLALTLASVVFGSLASKIQDSTMVAVEQSLVATGSLATQLPAPAFELIEVPDRATAEQLVRDGTVDAAVVPGGGGPLELTVLGDEGVPLGVVQALSVPPNVDVLNPSTTDGMLAYFVALGFGLIFMMSAVTFGATIAQSVVEEKQTRIVEILLAAVPARAMLAGKILGNSVLALGQVIAIIGLASLGMLATGQELLFGSLGWSLAWFGVLFAFGFVLLATMYAAAASLVSRQEDVGTVTSPVMMLVMIPYAMILIFSSNPQILAVMSYVPFSAPVGMPMRLFLGTAEWWEPLVSLGILCATIALVLLVAARIYEGSILRTGGRVPLKEALAGAK